MPVVIMMLFSFSLVSWSREGRTGPTPRRRPRNIGTHQTLLGGEKKGERVRGKKKGTGRIMCLLPEK